MSILRLGSPGSPAAESVRAGLFLFLLALIGLAAYTPWLGLVGDDWWFFANLSDQQFGNAAFYVNPARPVVACLWPGLWQVFGLRVWMYYVLNFVLQWLTAVVVFIMLRKVFRWGITSATAAAAFFLLYPADTAHVYLTHLAVRVCVLLAITGAFLWLRACTEPAAPVLKLSVSLILMALSLLTYETPVFLLALLPFALPFVARCGYRMCLRRALTCYAVLAAYLAFRLATGYVASQRPDRFYGSLQLAPDWILSQLQALPAATIWQGWLYALKAVWDFGLGTSGMLLILVMALLLLALRWLQRDSSGTSSRDWRGNLGLVGIGAVLSVAAVVPVVVSNLSLKNVVGTLEGRLVHGAALGHGVLVTGLCALPGSLLPLSRKTRILLRTMPVAVLLSIALLGSLGVQREYARAWRTQLDIVYGLQEHEPNFQDDTVIVLLDVPGGAFDARFYYPLTQLVRRFYSNPTLHALPWQRNFPPDQQPLAFGEEYAVAVVVIPQGDVITFDYDHMVAFRVGLDGELQAVRQIGTDYLCGDACGKLPFTPPEGWEPAREPIVPGSVQRLGSADVPPSTAWRQYLLSQVNFASRVELP